MDQEEFGIAFAGQNGIVKAFAAFEYPPKGAFMKSQLFRLLTLLLRIFLLITPSIAPAATVTWVGGSGDWSAATNWSAGQLPGPDDDVLIPSGPAITVTHSSGLDTVSSITNLQAFILAGGRLTVSNVFQTGGSLLLSGGALGSAFVLTTNGASVTANNAESTLDGVTVNGLLDVGNTYFSAILAVTNGLTLNGTMLVGNPTIGQVGFVQFSGSQSLLGSGTVVFGVGQGFSCGDASTLELLDGNTSLTIGPGITIRGQNGVIGGGSACGNAENVTVVNQGMISCDVPGGTIVLDGIGGPIINEGTMSANDATLQFPGAWQNSGSSGGLSQAVTLSGSFSDQGGVLAYSSGGSITGSLNNGNGQILVAGPHMLTLTGGAVVQGGTIVATNGASLAANNSGATLDGVAVNGLLDVGNTYFSAYLAVTNGLTLNGTMLVGNPTNGQVGFVQFSGSQSLLGSGTVVFGVGQGFSCGAASTLEMVDGNTSLTIGSGITIRGQNGVVGGNSPCGNVENVTVINNGIISCDVSEGEFIIQAQPFINNGTIQTLGGTISLSDNWINTGTISEVDGQILMNGVFSLQSSSVLRSSGGTLELTGALNNTNNTILLNGVGDYLLLNGVTIHGGVIKALNGAALIANHSGGVLDGVTIDGTLDVGNSYNGGTLTITNGLTLDGTMLLGNPSNDFEGVVLWAGTQNFNGDGMVVFGDRTGLDQYPNILELSDPGTTLTIGSGITISGQNGVIGAGSGTYFSGPTNVSVINWGTISCTISSGEIEIQGQFITNYGILNAASGSILSVVGDLELDAGGALSSQPAGDVELSSDLAGNTQNADQFLAQGTTEFLPGTHSLEVMSQDRGSSANGFAKNFAYGTIFIGSGAKVTLIDEFTNSQGAFPECLYANVVIVSSGSTLDLSGLRLYARLSQVAGTVTNGSIIQVPSAGGALTVNSSTLASITNAGTLDQWTFLGRANEQVVITVDAGSGNVITPQLGSALVQLFDPTTNLLAQTSNTPPQEVAGMFNVILPFDGLYTVTIQAPTSLPAKTGNYIVTVWDATPNVRPLVLNQVESGQIITPYSADEWNFSASAGTEVQFNFLNASTPNVSFALSGTNGWTGFSNLSASSGLVALPYSGPYTLAASTIGGAYDLAYSFELAQTTETNVSENQTFTGSFVGSGQAQLLAVTVTNSGPLLIMLHNTGSGNVAELYAQFGTAPTRGSFGYESINPNSSSQKILVPNAMAGTYYVLIYGNLITTPGTYAVQTVSANVLLTASTPVTAPNTAKITLTLSGSGFLPSTTVALVSTNGSSFPASSVSVDSFTQITATFASNTPPAGMYSLVATVSAGSSATLTNAFQATAGGAPLFTSSLIVPQAVAPGSPATAYSVYGNSGTAPMPAPLLVLTAEQNGVQGGLLGLDPSLLAQAVWTTAQQPLGYGNAAQFLASGRTPGVLQPGESLTMPVYWATFNGPLIGHRDVYWNLGVLYATNTTPIEWPSLQGSMQPAGIATDAWNAIFTALTNEVGPTWGNYVTALDNNASYLGQLGLNVQDVTKLLPFLIMQADGLCPIQTLASSMDASVIAPGLPLTFSRSYGERISQRYALGPFGQGWTHNWQYSLQQGSDGTVTVFGPGGSQRIFQPDKREGYFNQAGDYGRLAPDGGGGYALTEKTGLLSDYAANGTLNQVQDLNGNRITLGYSGALLTSLTHSSGQYIHIAYNGAGLIQTITDQLGHQTVLAYDSANQHLLGTQYFDGRTATYIYNTNGPTTQLHALTASSTSCCNWRYFTYDTLGRLSGTYLADAAEAKTINYGAGGQVTVTDALTNSTKFFYDYRGLLCKTVDALSNAVNQSFDASFNLVSLTDPTGRSYNYGFDTIGNLVQSADPLGDVSQFTYTAAYNRLSSVADAKGNTTQYGYDLHGNLQSTTYANNSVESWTYDSSGDPQTWINRRGHQTIYTNNMNGQITAKQFADGSLTTYSYDAYGNLTNTTTYDTNLSVLEPVSMTYDKRNHLTQIAYLGGKFLAFTYDSNNRRTSSVDQLGHTLNYYYDAAGRFQSLTNEQNALVVLYQYDPVGRVATKTLGNGMFTRYEYTPAGQVLGLSNFLSDSTLISFFNYTYDSRGRRTTMNSADGNWTHSYDDIGQLTHAVFASETTNIPNQDLAYAYDALGNRIQTIENGITTTYTANNLNQYVTVGQTNYTFNPDGNLIQQASTSGTTTYFYNDENRLISLVSSQGVAAYTYDGVGDQIKATENGTTKEYVIDPIGIGNAVGEYDGDGNLLFHYDYALRQLGLLSSTDAGGATIGYCLDAAGNVHQMVSQQGTIINAYYYDPFGGILAQLEIIPNPFSFVGQEGVRAGAYGVNFMRERYYSPAVGRFLSADPLGIASGDLNLYRYGFNSAPNESDPTGLTSSWLCGLSGLPLDLGVGVSYTLAGIPFSALPAGSFLLPLLRVPKLIWSPVIDWVATTAGVSSLAAGGAVGLLLIPTVLWVNYSINFECNGGSLTGLWNYLTDYVPPKPCDFIQVSESFNCILQGAGTGSSTAYTPGDPNGLYGPAGFMTGNYVVDSGLFNYEIFFENETNATAPAQIIQISNPLSTNLNWQTFQLTEIAFGNTFNADPPNVQQFQTNLAFSDNCVSFQVQINAGINLDTGAVFANLFSVEPTTGLPPNANVGFLPPENGTGVGMGHVSYIIQPRPNLHTYLQISNVAYIQFDENPVIATDQVNRR